MTGQMRNEKLPALAEALSGMRFGPRHARAAASLLRSTGLLDAGLPELQERVTAHLAAIPASRGADCYRATGPGTGQAGGAAALPAAYAAANTDTFPRERFRRPPSRPGRDGRKKAGCAVGRSILVIVRHLLNDPAARYRDLGPDRHARHSDRSRNARNARRQLEALGNDVIITLREDAA